MRRSLTLACVLLLLSAGVLLGAFALSRGWEAGVLIDADTLSGDPAAAEGIAVQVRAGCGGHLFWDTACRAGKNPSTQTDFSFSGAERRETRPRSPSLSLYVSCDGGVSGSDIDLLSDDQWGLTVRPAAALAERTAPGEKRTETLSLHDYYDVYPLFLDLSLPDCAYNGTEELQKAVRDYFQFPVPEDHFVQVTVQKDGGGSVSNVEISSVGGTGTLSTASVVTESGCFLAFSGSFTDRASLDFSRVPGGYGLYYLPLEKSQSQDCIVTLTAGAITRVFPIDEKASEVYALAASADGEELFLFTREAEAFWLTVLDASGTRQLQKFSFMPAGEGSIFWNQWFYPEFMVIQTGEGNFALIRSDGEGGYETAFTCDAGEDGFKLLGHDAVFAYDGVRLAAATPQDYSLCSFYLSVFEEGRLAYAGLYRHSLDLSPPADYAYRCRLAEADPLELSFLPS